MELIFFLPVPSSVQPDFSVFQLQIMLMIKTLFLDKRSRNSHDQQQITLCKPRTSHVNNEVPVDDHRLITHQCTIITISKLNFHCPDERSVFFFMNYGSWNSLVKSLSQLWWSQRRPRIGSPQCMPQSAKCNVPFQWHITYRLCEMNGPQNLSKILLPSQKVVFYTKVCNMFNGWKKIIPFPWQS